MPVRSEEREEFLADIITTAIEGGTGYWALVHEYKWSERPPSEVYAVISEDEEQIGSEAEAPGYHRIDIDVIAKGIGRIREDAFPINSHLKAEILLADRENEGGDIDADSADAIVQAAIFGELVYG